MIPEQQVTALSTPVYLTGRTALVVGATAGIGREVARQLAAAGATTILAGRDPAKLAAVAAELAGAAPGGIRTIAVDPAELASIRRAAAQLNADYPVLDIVVANASIVAAGKQRTVTRDGFETTFGVNHLGNAALLLALERPIRAAKNGRVLIVASKAHRRAKGLPLDDLMGERKYDSLVAYSRSKLANILFARQLAERWPGTTVYAAHPGDVLTDMMRTLMNRNTLFRLAFRVMKSKLLDPETAAAGLVRVAVDPTLTEPSGAYFELGRPDSAADPAGDRTLGRALFDRTVALTTAA